MNLTLTHIKRMKCVFNISDIEIEAKEFLKKSLTLMILQKMTSLNRLSM